MEINLRIKEKLNLLAELQTQAQVVTVDYDKLRKSIIPPEIQKELDDLDAEFKASFQILSQRLLDLEAEIKAEVRDNGESVSGTFLTAIFSGGAVTWDSDALKEYAKNGHGELWAYRNYGKASVSIRKKPNGGSK